MSRYRKRNRRQVDGSRRDDSVPHAVTRDRDIAQWCVSMGLQPNGQPLGGMDAARRAAECQRQNEQALRDAPLKDTMPFWRRSYATDI